VLPGSWDSHAPTWYFAGERSAEFAARMAGRPYQAGGIRTRSPRPAPRPTPNCAHGLHRLAGRCSARARRRSSATSGYGLTKERRGRCAALAAELTDEVTLPRGTWCRRVAADPAGYLDLVCGPMLAACAAHCRWATCSAERGAFGEDEGAPVLGRLARACSRGSTRTSLAKGRHPACRGARRASADHCTFVTDADVSALASARTVATLLPGAEFSTRQALPGARRLLTQRDGRPGDDCNPGTSYTTSMPSALLSRTRHAHDNGGSGLSATRRAPRCARGTSATWRPARARPGILDAPSPGTSVPPGVPLGPTRLSSGRARRSYRIYGHRRGYSTITTAEADQGSRRTRPRRRRPDRGESLGGVAGRGRGGRPSHSRAARPPCGMRAPDSAPCAAGAASRISRALGPPALAANWPAITFCAMKQGDREPLRGERRGG